MEQNNRILVLIKSRVLIQLILPNSQASNLPNDRCSVLDTYRLIESHQSKFSFVSKSV